MEKSKKSLVNHTTNQPYIVGTPSGGRRGGGSNYVRLGSCVGTHNYVSWNPLGNNDPQPSLGHYQGGSLTHPMLIICFA